MRCRCSYSPLTHRPARLAAPPARAAFTLVELLVAIVIFTILATIAIAAFTESDQDRAAAGSQTLRSALEGARSRAIHDEQIRGVRLLVDPNNPRTVTSLVYVGSPATYTGTLDVADITDDGGSPPIWTFEDPSTSGRWANLMNRGFLVSTGNYPNARIRFPSLPGANWFPIWSITDDGSGNVTMEIAGDFSAEYTALGAATTVDYEIILAPPVLASAVPQALPAGIAIDLDGSKLPDSWRDDNGTAGDATDDTFSPQMDILFTPRGDVTGIAAAEGILIFYLADTENITNAGPRFEQNVIPAATMTKHDGLVTVFARTGLVTTAQVNRFSVVGEEYQFAIYGEDAP
jgi:prepilin-type N-terminal cleavage/methylation domain-containing protein